MFVAHDERLLSTRDRLLAGMRKNQEIEGVVAMQWRFSVMERQAEENLRRACDLCDRFQVLWTPECIHSIQLQRCCEYAKAGENLPALVCKSIGFQIGYM